jgi:dipeptidase E
MSRLLLLSNSTMPGTPFFSWPTPYVREFLDIEKERLLFIPFAAVTFSYDEYSAAVSEAFGRMGYQVRSIHHEKDFRQAINDASVLIVGGGNTFALLDSLYRNDLVGLINEKVRWGTPYIGWSAGANIACPTLMTTNDMPIVFPGSFEALNLVPFQINSHYTDFKQPGHGGETRRQRIEEFLALNPAQVVIGLPEGTLLTVDENKMNLQGNGAAFWFAYDQRTATINPGEDISFLLKQKA